MPQLFLVFSAIPLELKNQSWTYKSNENLQAISSPSNFHAGLPGIEKLPEGIASLRSQFGGRFNPPTNLMKIYRRFHRLQISMRVCQGLNLEPVLLESTALPVELQTLTSFPLYAKCASCTICNIFSILISPQPFAWTCG